MVYYSLHHSESERPLKFAEMYPTPRTIKDARKIALDYVKYSDYTDSVLIQKDWENYMLIQDNGTAVYMKGDFIAEDSPVMVLNSDGSIRKTYGKVKKKSAKQTKKRK